MIDFPAPMHFIGAIFLICQFSENSMKELARVAGKKEAESGLIPGRRKWSSHEKISAGDETDEWALINNQNI